MEAERDVPVSPTTEVPVVEGELVLAIRALADCGVGSKAIARAVGVARNTVRRYLRQPIEAEGQRRPTAWHACRAGRAHAGPEHRRGPRTRGRPFVSLAAPLSWAESDTSSGVTCGRRL
jgi:hypothetical protein